MYAGHFAVGLAAGTMRRDAPLALFLIASVLIDLLVAEDAHTVPVVVVAALAVTVGARVWRMSWPTALVAGAVVLSHLPLDLVTSELHLWPGDAREVGLALYDVPAADFAIEAALLIAGWLIWRRARHPAHRPSIRMLAALVGPQIFFSAFIAAHVLD